MNRRLYSLIFAFTAFINTYSQDYKSINDSLISEAKKLSASDNITESLKIINGISNLSPEYNTATIEKLRIFYKQQKYQEGIETALKINKKELSDDLLADYYTIVGSLYDKNKETEKALSIYNEGLKIFPNHYLLYFNKAITYIAFGDNKSAYENLKKSIEIFPNYARSHYFIGLIALDNRNLSEATLAITTSILLDNGSFSTNAIRSINDILAKKYEEPEKIIELEGSEQFEDIENAIRKQYALDNSYKLNSELNFPYTKQLQALIAECSKIKNRNGFYASKYLDFYADLQKDNQVENLTYYLFKNFDNDAIQKIVSKKSSNIKKFEEWFYPNLIKSITTTNFNGKKVNVISEELNIGYGEFLNNKKNGLWIYNTYYGKKAIETTFKENVRIGNYTSYHPNGLVDGKINFINGQAEGKAEFYYDNGNPKISKDFKNGKVTGFQNTYYYLGGIECSTELKENINNGKQTCYYNNGNIKVENIYAKGELQDKRSEYYPNKSIKEATSIKDNYYEGERKVYFPDKTIQEEYTYKNGKTIGEEKIYYPNGDLKFISNADGSLVKKFFGKELKEETISKGNKITNQIHYVSGKPILNLKFATNNVNLPIASYQLYTDSGTSESEVKINLGTPFEIKTSKNKLFLSGSYNASGQRIGEWKYYNLISGLLESKAFYENDIQTNYSEYYYKNGKVRDKFAVKDNKKNGPSIQYYNIDTKAVETSYVNDLENGNIKAYYENGKIKRELFADNGKITGKSNYYNIDETLSSIINHKNNDIISEDYYFQDKLVATTDYSKNGEQSHVIKNKSEVQTIQLLNGFLEGKTTIKSDKNEISFDADYINGYQYGISKKYHPNGKIYTENNFLEGKTYGDYKIYDINGNLINKRKNYNGNTFGTLERFTPQGNKYLSSEYYEDLLHGASKYYGSNNELLLTINYIEGTPVSYQKNQETSSTPIGNELIKITSNYKNGNEGISLVLKNGETNGNYKLFHENGTPLITSNYNDDYLDGEKRIYDNSGKIYAIESFKNGESHGKQEYYHPNGKVKISAHYQNDFLDGPFLEYNENGQLISSKKFDSGILIENK